MWLWPFPGGLRGSWVLEFGVQKEAAAGPLRRLGVQEGIEHRFPQPQPQPPCAQLGRQSGFDSPALGPAGRLGVAARSGDARCHPARSPLPEPREDRRAAAERQRFGPSERTSPSYGLQSFRFGSRCRRLELSWGVSAGLGGEGEPWGAGREPTCGQRLSLGFPRQGYWSGLPFPSPDPGVQPESPALAGGFFSTDPPGKP